MIRIICINLLANGLHRDLFQICLLEDVFEQFLDVVVGRCSVCARALLRWRLLQRLVVFRFDFLLGVILVAGNILALLFRGRRRSSLGSALGVLLLGW